MHHFQAKYTNLQLYQLSAGLFAWYDTKFTTSQYIPGFGGDLLHLVAGSPPSASPERGHAAATWISLVMAARWHNSWINPGLTRMAKSPAGKSWLARGNGPMDVGILSFETTGYCWQWGRSSASCVQESADTSGIIWVWLKIQGIIWVWLKIQDEGTSMIGNLS